MKKNQFFEELPILIKLKLVNKFSNLSGKKNRKIAKKQYKYYISLIKQYRYLGILPYSSIKFFKN